MDLMSWPVEPEVRLRRAVLVALLWLVSGCGPTARPANTPAPPPATKPPEAQAARPFVRTDSEPQALPAPHARTEAAANERPRAREGAKSGGARLESANAAGFERGTVEALSGTLSGSGVGYGNGALGASLRSRSVASAPRIAAHDAYGPMATTGQGANSERYAHAVDNAFERTGDAPLSTFSIDVDTASYANVRRYLKDGERPPIDAVRIEELVNYFQYDYAPPTADAPFGVSTEVAPAPWNAKHRLVRIGLQTRAIAREAAPASNLVFLIDVSGSMAGADRLPLLKRGLALLARNLRAQDKVAIVVYAGASGLVLPSTSGAEQARVLAALEQLEAGGSTNGGAGIQLAYSLAESGYIRGGNNRVILASDGDFNVGTTSEGELVRLIEDKRKSGVFLTVLGFGRGNLNDTTMESLADHGNGNYAYIDSLDEAHKVLVREAGSTLVTVAKDVKIQVEWNPKQVASYRLIGFENRMLAARDFNDDTKDAGEIGAGHSMTALYEIVLAAEATAVVSAAVDPLRYQTERASALAAESGELMSLKIRYKRPSGDTSQLWSVAVRDTGLKVEQTSNDFRFAAAVACFGMLLRDSEHKGSATIKLASSLARAALGSDPHGQRHELVHLLDQAARVGVASGEPKATAQVAK